MLSTLVKPKFKCIWQLLGTLVILAFVPGNLVKTCAFLLLWGITFYPLSAQELFITLGTCVFFPIMDVVVINQGNFYYTHPDFGVLPLWEIFIYGFYILHTLRTLKGPVPAKEKIKPWLLAGFFSLTFGTVANEILLTSLTFCLLIFGLIWFHEKWDFIYTGYFIFLGVITEYTGVLSNQWGYHGQYFIGIPLWFVTLWGSIGLLLRRLLVPLL